MPETVKTIEVFYTADLVTPNGTDTNAYGEPCEPGHGYSLESGWLDPDWSMWEVFPEQSDVRPDVLPSIEDRDGQQSVAEWLAETIAERIGAVDGYDGSSTFYGADAQTDMHTGQSVRIAAHVYGITDYECNLVHYCMTR